MKSTFCSLRTYGMLNAIAWEWELSGHADEAMRLGSWLCCGVAP